MSTFLYQAFSDDRPSEWWRLRTLSRMENESHAALLHACGNSSGWLNGGWLAAWGCRQLQVPEQDFFSVWQQTAARAAHPLVVLLSYDLKNQVEPHLSSSNEDATRVPDAVLFEGETVILADSSGLKIYAEYPERVLKELEKTSAFEAAVSFFEGEVHCRMPRETYLKQVSRVIEEIRCGQVYELNLCVEHLARSAKLDDLSAFEQLIAVSPVPFAAWFRCGDFRLCCASPERFLHRNGTILRSQPIKGTRPRSADPEQDRRLAEELRNSEKERAENVMIVDLVRNDLSKHCLPGSVEVEELFGIYSFQQVHQMISTIRGKMEDPTRWVEAVKGLFPMGSMTGAPKVSAMQLIEALENSRRGWYSGSIGYQLPDGDFDLNVIIRSLVYNQKDSVLSYMAGGAITWDSKPEDEWEEIQAKTSAIRRVLFG